MAKLNQKKKPLIKKRILKTKLSKAPHYILCVQYKTPILLKEKLKEDLSRIKALSKMKTSLISNELELILTDQISLINFS